MDINFENVYMEIWKTLKVLSNDFSIKYNLPSTLLEKN